MKLCHSYYILALLAVMLACNTSKVPSAEELEKERKIEEKVTGKNLTVEVSQAIPMRGRSINLTSMYELRIKNDSAYAHLPYFGVAHSAPYGGGEGGVRFDSEMEDYSLKPAKDGWDIKFNIKSREYNYSVLLSVFKNGNSSISVNSYQRDPISFYGKVKE